MSESFDDLETVAADDLPVVRILQLADVDPSRALRLLDRLTDDRDYEWWVLARFRAYQTLASAPFIRARVPPNSRRTELLGAAEGDTIHLCEMAVAELAKIEQASIELTYLTVDQFTSARDEGIATDRLRADAICTILERLCPLRVQELRGKTMLKYLGPARVGGLSLQKALGPAGVDRLVNILFEAQRQIGCVIASEVADARNGARVVAFRAFEEVTEARPESDPGRCMGTLRLSEDGVYDFTAEGG